MYKIIKGPAFISLAFAETIPNVTVVARPNGLPIAKAQFPTFALSESPQLTGFNSRSVSTLKLLNLFFCQNLSTLLVKKFHHVKLQL